MRHPIAAALAALLLSGCGAIGGSGGGDAHLPVSGSGPFSPLPDDPNIPISAPFVLSDPAHDLDDPTVVVWGDALALWVTVDRDGTTDIEHADANELTQGFGPLYPGLQADQGWEAGSVSGPSVIWDQPWVLFYSAGGAIGWATAADGHTYVKAPGPALMANQREEGNLLGKPAAVRLGDRVRVYYDAEGKIWAAEASWADVAAGRATTWTRLDGDPSTPERDPMVAAAPFAVSLGRPQARAALTPAGRLRYDLYFTASTGTEVVSTCGFASSFTGDRFEVAQAPILPLTATSSGPAETPYQDHAVLLYSAQFGARRAIAAAVSP